MVSDKHVEFIIKYFLLTDVIPPTTCTAYYTDFIEIGDATTAFEDIIHAPITIKTAKEKSNYEIVVHDAASTKMKEVLLDSNGVSGIHTLDNVIISFDPSNGIGDVTLRAGKATSINIGSTPKDQSVTIDTSSQSNVSIPVLLCDVLDNDGNYSCFLV